MQTKTLGFVILLVIVALIGANSLYIVNEYQRGVLLRLGKLHNDDIKPGLHIKIPVVDEVRLFDARILTVDTRPERFLTVEKKSMEVDSFTKWRIIDVGKYYTATNGEEDRAMRLLSQRVNEGLRNQFAQRTLQEVVSGERDLLMSELVEQLNGFTQDSLGVEVVDVRVKKIDLPGQLSDAVFQRMRAEREREARDHRSKGKEQAEIIRADADRQKAVLEAQAYRDAELLRGEGDAKAAAIYADAYNKDPEFYAFQRSLNAYRNAFNSKDDVMLVDPKSDFFRYLNNAKGK
ncbi:protease modulator HflC [Agaribacterium haliotis]|uniref:protease modulator HflC n=1 Tax=Agaribacterium haliotis TaxID=2013869 RepID=UPI000BB5852E|nr:protease modulator HflC [Agaribacterium haliotis]